MSSSPLKLFGDLLDACTERAGDKGKFSFDRPLAGGARPNGTREAGEFSAKVNESTCVRDGEAIEEHIDSDLLPIPYIILFSFKYSTYLSDCRRRSIIM